jgi:hypothetical protein
MGLEKYVGSINLYDIFADKHNLKRPPGSLEDIKMYFEVLRDSISKGDPIGMEIASELMRGVCRREIWKNHVAAKNIEKFIVNFLGGVLSSPKNRPDAVIPPIPGDVCIPNPSDFARGVKRAMLEKTDIFFPGTGLRCSLKSIIPDNNEINVGSFPQRLLFGNILDVVPDERKGLGSPKRLRGVFEEIQRKGKQDVFTKRFEYMVDAIFDDIHFIIIERYPEPDPKIVVYLVDSENFRNLLKERIVKGPEKLLEVWYRYELHSLRLRKEPIIEKGTKIEINLREAKSPLFEYFKSLEERYRDMLAGKLSINDFKKEVESLTRKFLSSF